MFGRLGVVFFLGLVVSTRGNFCWGNHDPIWGLAFFFSHGLIGETPLTSKIRGMCKVYWPQTCWSLSARKFNRHTAFGAGGCVIFRWEDLTYHYLRDFFCWAKTCSFGFRNLLVFMGIWEQSLCYLFLGLIFSKLVRIKCSFLRKLFVWFPKPSLLEKEKQLSCDHFTFGYCAVKKGDEIRPSFLLDYI